MKQPHTYLRFTVLEMTDKRECKCILHLAPKNSPPSIRFAWHWILRNIYYIINYMKRLSVKSIRETHFLYNSKRNLKTNICYLRVSTWTTGTSREIAWKCIFLPKVINSLESKIIRHVQYFCLYLYNKYLVHKRSVFLLTLWIIQLAITSWRKI